MIRLISGATRLSGRSWRPGCTAARPRIVPPSTRTLSAFPPSFEVDDEPHHPSHPEGVTQPLHPAQNIRLEAIKSAGLTQLVNATRDLVARTRRPLFDDVPLDARGNKPPSIAQTQEAQRLESALVEALDAFSARDNTFSVGGQCIEVLGVEVSADLKTAKTYWCLPRGIDLRKLSQSKLEGLLRKMQQRLETRGGRIQAMVHTRLRAYYPPRIEWVAAEHVSKDLKRGVSIEGGGKKKRRR